MTTKAAWKPDVARQRIQKQLDEGKAILHEGRGGDGSDVKDVWIDVSL